LPAHSALPSFPTRRSSDLFVNGRTRMNPNLLYGQAIKGRATGRGTGIIDTIHLVEVARAAWVLERMGYLKGETLAGTKRWFRQRSEEHTSELQSLRHLVCR